MQRVHWTGVLGLQIGMHTRRKGLPFWRTYLLHWIEVLGLQIGVHARSKASPFWRACLLCCLKSPLFNPCAYVFTSLPLEITVLLSRCTYVDPHFSLRSALPFWDAWMLIAYAGLIVFCLVHMHVCSSPMLLDISTFLWRACRHASCAVRNLNSTVWMLIYGFYVYVNIRLLCVCRHMAAMCILIFSYYMYVNIRLLCVCWHTAAMCILIFSYYVYVDIRLLYVCQYSATVCTSTFGYYVYIDIRLLCVCQYSAAICVSIFGCYVYVDNRLLCVSWYSAAMCMLMFGCYVYVDIWLSNVWLTRGTIRSM